MATPSHPATRIDSVGMSARPRRSVVARLVVAAALAGMAAGRVVSALIDRRFDAWPLRYCVLETVMAVSLVQVR